MNKLISIIIPMFNAEKFILNTLQNIEQQQIENYEIIIIDDGSKDNSYNICQEYIKNNKTIDIKIIKQENGGPSSARNVGIKLARGKYVFFKDVDDYYSKNALKDMIEQMKENSLVISGIKINRNKKELINIFSNNEKISNLSKSDISKVYISGLLNSPANKLYDLKLIKKKKIMFDEDIYKGEDLRFNVKYWKFCSKEIICINEPLYIYNQTNEGINLKYRNDEVESCIGNFRYLLQFIENEPDMDVTNKGDLYQIYIYNLVDRLWRYLKNEKRKRNNIDIDFKYIIQCTNYTNAQKELLYFMTKHNMIIALKVYLKILKILNK